MTIHPETGTPYDRINPTNGLLRKNYKDPGIIKKLKIRGEKSPDIHRLKFYKEIPFFAYGTEKVNGEDENLLKGAKYLGMAHTMSTNFIMKSNTAFPVAFPCKQDDQRRGRLRGEMYLVSPEHIIAMDIGNSNGKSFYRFKARFALEEQEMAEGLKSFKGDPYIPAYMYLGSTQWWGDNNDKLQLACRKSYSGSVKPIFHGKHFYEWDTQPEDDENDEWGWRGAGAYYGRQVRSH